MFPVRFPSMICQWNMSWGRDSESQTLQTTPFCLDLENTGERAL